MAKSSPHASGATRRRSAKSLERLVGTVDSPTKVADLNMPKRPPPTKAATGIVKRVELPGAMSPLKIKPLVDDAKEASTPHYAKLRAESSGDQLYLGFFLDPLYRVHWNNKAPALKFEIEAPDGVAVSPDSGSGPKLEVDADADPREFLLTVTGRSDDPLKVTVKYFACDDAETFCVPVTQVYEVSFERDRDGGSRRSGAAGRGGRGRRTQRRGAWTRGTVTIKLHAGDDQPPAGDQGVGYRRRWDLVGEGIGQCIKISLASRSRSRRRNQRRRAPPPLA